MVIGVLSEGDCFGERALLKYKPYSETALALTDCEFSVIRREHLSFAMINDQNLRRTIDAYINCDDSEELAYNQLHHRQ
jgi:CRP-like cAMP-binding protein